MENTAYHAGRLLPYRMLRTAAAASLLLHAWPAGAGLTISPDGKTVNDSANGINWLADANLAASNRFGLPLCNGANDTTACVNASGSMSYQAALAWVAAMNTANYQGHSNWQLPTTPLSEGGCSFLGPQSNSFGWNCTASAMGSLYYTALGFSAPATTVPIPANTVGPFSNFQPYLYWSQSNDVQTGNGYYTFSFNSGFKGSNTIPNFLYVLPMVAGKLAGTAAASGQSLQVNPGGQTLYDPVANVTWLANANLAASNSLGLSTCTAPGKPQLCVNADGAMNWNSASQFIANMNAANYLGQANWQLPPIDAACGGYNCAGNGSPMGELFYGQGGLSAGSPIAATPYISVGPFHNLQPYLYWSCQGTSVTGACQSAGPAPNFEWSFSFGNGFEGTDLLQNDLYATAYYAGAAPTIAPAAGYWWNTAEPGRGFVIEIQGSDMFMAGFLYAQNGEATWVASSGTMAAPEQYSGSLITYANGQTLSGAYVPAKAQPAIGTLAINFSSNTRGTLTWPGGSIPIQRFDFGPGGAAATQAAGLPNTGWWYNPAEGGRGFAIEIQGGSMYFAAYMYDSAGNPLWYLASGAMTNANLFQGTLMQYGNGQTLSGAFQPASIVNNLGVVTLQFSSAASATLTLPNGRQIPLTRFSF